MLDDDEKEEERDFSNATLDKLLGVLSHRNRRLCSEDKRNYAEWLREIQRHNPGVLSRNCLDWLDQMEASRQSEPDKKPVPPRVLFKELREELKRRGEAKEEIVSESELETLRNIVQNAKYEDRQIRKQDHMLRMLDKWCEKRKHSLVLEGELGSGELTSEEKEEWKTLFQELQTCADEAEEVRNLILPVQIDPNTGVGLYLVGKEQFWNEDFKKELFDQINFVFLCFGPDLMVDNTNKVVNNPEKAKRRNLKDLENKLETGVSLSLKLLRGDLAYEVTFEGGQELFSHCRRDEGLAYGSFRTNNGFPPPGVHIPRKLRRYFEVEVDWEAMADEGMRRSKEDDKAYRYNETTADWP